MEAVDSLVPVSDPPTSQQYLDVLFVGFVVIIFIGYEEQVGWRADKYSSVTNGNGRREWNALRENLFAIRHPILVGIFQNQDTAVTGIGKPLYPGFIIPVLGDPHPAPVVPAEGNWLGNHGFGSKGVYNISFFD